MTSRSRELRTRLLQPIESIPSTVLAGLSPSLERRRASVTAASIRPRTGASSDYVLSSLAAQPYDLIYLMKCIYAQPRETKLGEEGDPRQQALYDRILMPIYDVVLHLCPLFADKMIDNRAKFTVVVRRCVFRAARLFLRLGLTLGLSAHTQLINLARYLAEVFTRPIPNDVVSGKKEMRPTVLLLWNRCSFAVARVPLFV